MLDVERSRAQFPALSLTLEDGRACAFLDNPAGTQVPTRVIDAIGGYLTRSNANTGGAFLTSRRTDESIDAARSAMADLLGAPDSGCIVFGANMTTLTFSFSRAIGRTLAPGDEVLCTMLDHDGNIAPWLALEADRGIVVRFADIHSADGTLDLDDVQAKLTPKTRLMAVTYASNALGTVNDVARITRMAHDAGALAWIDAVHYTPHGPIDVAALDCDFLVCSAYKFFGPHIGVVYGKRAHLERFQPYKVRPSSDDAPERWETGTLNHECLAGVTAAVEYIASLGEAAGPLRRDRIVRAMHEIRTYERTLSERLIAGVRSIDGMHVFGLTDARAFDQRVPTVACRLDGVSPRAMAERLGEEGIFVWDGNYYALAVMERLGLEATGGAVRIGPVHYNTVEEVDRAVAVLGDLAATSTGGRASAAVVR